MRSAGLRRAVAVVLIALLVLGAGALTLALADTGEPAARPKRFWTDDKSYYRSPWYGGKHRIMIPFGCTKAPYYSPDPRCPGRQGYHHGLDIAMRCGTKLYSNLRARVVDPNSPGAPGASYGAKAFRIRHGRFDFLFAHVQRVYVQPGQRVQRGQLIARAGKLGAPDGCHLHFEARPKGGGYTTAIRPRPWLHLSRVPADRG